MTFLNAAERKTLETLANPDSTDGLCRTHLEKLSRLDLIEPAAGGVCVTVKGKEILFSGK